MTLSASQRATLDALCRTIVPGDAPRPDDVPTLELALEVERRLGDASPRIARRFRLALDVFGHPLAGLLDIGRPEAFASLPLAARDARLGAWCDSALPWRRTVYQGLRRFILAAHYASPRALAELGWMGPLHERAPALAWEGALPGSDSDAEPVRRDGSAVPDAVDASRRRARSAAAFVAPPERPVHAGVLRGADVPRGSPLRAGVCVIGSGSGGAVAASRLAEQGHEVIVLEEGSWWEPGDFTEREGEMMPRLYAEGGLRATEDLSISILQGSAVGGSALVNWLVMLRTPEWVLEEWRREHGAEGMSARELAPVFERIERDTHTRCVPDDAHSPSNRVLLDGARSLGWSARAAEVNVEGCVRAGTCGLGCHFDAKRGPATVYLPRALRAGARLVTQCRVDRVEIVGRGASALKRVHCTALGPETGSEAGRLTIEAPVVVLAAGAVGTPAILLRSGLGGAATGRYLRLHPTTAVVGVYDRVMYAAAGIPLSAVCDEFLRRDGDYGFWLESAPLYPAFSAAALPGWGEAHRARMLGFARLSPLIALVRDGAERMRSSGDVRLDRNGGPVVRYRLSAADRDTLVRGVQAAARLHLAAGAAEAFSLHERLTTVRSQADIATLGTLDFASNRFGLFSAHVMGSCRLGTDRLTSACAPDGAVRGVSGVYVADGSLLPTAPSVNPQETIMALASVVADRIHERHPTA